MAYKLSFTPGYLKRIRKLSAAERKQVSKKLELLAENPAYPSLRTKILRGHSGVWESSVNMDIRLIWKYKGDTIIVMVDIGHHDVLKKY